MPRHAPALECSPEDKETLVAISKSRNEELRIVERAQIILASLEGKEIQEVARELGLSIPTVDKWRRRFSLFGLRGLWDQPRSGKPAKYDAHFRNRVLALLEQPPPPHLSHWDGPAIAERLEASVYAVWRVLRREGIYLQRQRSWCVSTDKQFAPKAADVIALYLTARQCSGSERGRKAQGTGDRTPFWLRRDRQRESGARVEEHVPTPRNVKSFRRPGGRHRPSQREDYGVQKAGRLSELPGWRDCGATGGQRDSRHPRQLLHTQEERRMAGQVPRPSSVPLHADLGKLAKSDRDRVWLAPT